MERKIIEFKGKKYELDITKYCDGKTALVLRRSQDDYIKCTVNVEDVQLEENEVLIKNYSENTGIFEILIEAEIIEDAKRIHEIDYGTHKVVFPIGRLLINKEGE